MYEKVSCGTNPESIHTIQYRKVPIFPGDIWVTDDQIPGYYTEFYNCVNCSFKLRVMCQWCRCVHGRTSTTKHTTYNFRIRRPLPEFCEGMGEEAEAVI